ncbi:MAG: translocation/assembly module TamB domain-containing protein [Deltaproteobacteria bacterium]|nr:translocation/assembly module TamB domain-containing protein [Deltaproteobacteria bacterium]
MNSPKPAKVGRRRRLLLWGLLLTAALLGVAGGSVYYWAYKYRNGPALARIIVRTVNPLIKGKMELTSVRWGSRALFDLIVGLPHRAAVRGFRIHDSEGRLVLDVPAAWASVELRPLLASGKVRLTNVRAYGAYVLVAPLSRDASKVGLLGAFDGRRPSRRGGPGLYLSMEDVRVVNSRAEFSWPGWGARVDRFDPHGRLRFFGHGGIEIDASAQAGSGQLRFGDFRLQLLRPKFPRVSLIAGVLGFSLGTSIEGGTARAKGALGGLQPGARPRIDAALDVSQGGGILVKLLDGWLDRVRIADLKLKGPLKEMTVGARATGVRAKLGPNVFASIDSADLSFSVADLALVVRNIKAHVDDGAVSGFGKFDFRNERWEADLTLDRVRPELWYADLVGRVDGRIKLRGRLRAPSRTRAELALRLRHRLPSLPRLLRIDGVVGVGNQLVDLLGVRVSGAGNALSCRGSLNIEQGRVNMRAKLSLEHPDQLIPVRGLREMLSSLTADVRVYGRIPRLKLGGTVVAKNVGIGPLRVPAVSAEVSGNAGTIALSRIRAQATRGRISGSAEVALFSPRNLRPLPTPRLRSQLSVNQLDLRTFDRTADAPVKGRLSGRLVLDGPIDGLVGSAEVALSDLSLYGKAYRSARLRAAIGRAGVTVAEGVVTSQRGGVVRFTGDAFYDGRLAMSARARDLGLRLIPRVDSLPFFLDGALGGRVAISGTLRDPRFAGTLQIDRLKVRQLLLGRAKIELTPGSDIIRLRGALTASPVRWDGYVMMQPRPRIHLTTSFDRFELEQLIPELRQVGEVSTKTTGTVQIDADADRGLSWASANFSRLDVELKRYDGSTSRRVRLSAQKPIVARYDGKTLRLISAHLRSTVSDKQKDVAEFDVSGWLTGQDSLVRLRGRLALALAEFFASSELRRVEGVARTNLELRGPPGRQALNGHLTLQDVSVLIRGFDRPLQIPAARLVLEPKLLRIQRLPLVIDRQQLVVAGQIALDGLSAERIKLAASGQFNVQLLGLLFPKEFSHAVGSVQIDRFSAEGPISDPRLRGRVTVRRVEVIPRGWGRTITLTAGSVALKDYKFSTVGSLEGRYDDGRLSLTGYARLDRLRLADLFLRVRGTAIPLRQPKVYLAEANVNLVLQGDEAGLSLGGSVDLVDARYIREFDVVKNAFIRPRTYEEETPFWKGRPLLAELALNRVIVRSTGQLAVKNRYGNLSLDGGLVLLGTLSAPRLGGVIRVTEGAVRIPFLRGEYTIERGTIAFNERQEAEDGQINLVAENRIERQGTEYLIKLRLAGPLKSARLSLSSEPQLSQGDILVLLFTGRTFDQLRKELRTGTGTGAADTQVKTVTGDLIGVIVEDQIKKVTRLDLFRLEVGTETLGVRACKKFGRYLESCFFGEQGLIDDEQRGELLVKGKLHDYLRLIGRAQKLSTRLDTEDEDNQRMRLEIKFGLRIR